MKIAVFGVGGVGGYFGARLAESGEDVAFIARGPHLDAIRERGLRVDSVLGDMRIEPARASDSPVDIGPVDAVLLGVKTWQVASVAPSLKPLLGPETFVVPLQNGVEAAAVLAAELGVEQVVGGLCGGFCFVVGPGHIKHIGGATFVKFGELLAGIAGANPRPTAMDGGSAGIAGANPRPSARVERLRAAFARARVDVEVPPDIRVALWMKLMLVVPFGSVGAVARAPIGVLLTTPETRDLVERGMEEIAAVARAEGASLPADAVAKTLALLDGVTPSGTASMQRDIAAGKRSELDEWTGAVARLGAKHGVPTPVHSFIYASLLPLEQRARGEIAFD
ncbi:MAG TPA: 2-dehydropantoate 2-reductase [Gammaproteobacteria bacterium]|nr:2-dehydropantoate 2-reductase [Gammaproteobacteria bacterium]